MNNTWIRTNLNFGVPWITFTLPMRSILGKRFYTNWVEWTKALVQDNAGVRAKQINILARGITGLVEEARQSLKPVTVIALECRVFTNEWAFTIISPHLPRVEQMNVCKTERLELCPVCQKPLGGGGIGDNTYWKKFRKDEDGFDVKEVCSKTCADAPVAKIVEVSPTESWQVPPTVCEHKIEFYGSSAVENATDFDNAWEKMVDKHEASDALEDLCQKAVGKRIEFKGTNQSIYSNQYGKELTGRGLCIGCHNQQAFWITVVLDSGLQVFVEPSEVTILN